MKRISRLEDSKLFQRLEAAPADNATDRKQLAAHVSRVVEQAAWISAQINRFLPQYTLHNDTHLFNVLSIMEELLPDETPAALSPLECALCILAAFTHDLGMALSAEEHHRLYDAKTDTPERQAFLRHRERFTEETRQIERLEKERDEGARFRASLIEGHILADYLRRTHASDTKRVLDWFDRIEEATGNKALFKYGNFDFKERLALIGVSHNGQLRGPGLAQFETESDERIVRFVDPEGREPATLAVYGYDLVFPLTNIPIGRLRRDCPDWRTDRSLRPIGILPFLYLGQGDVWREHTKSFQGLFPVPQIYALLPRFALWEKPFADWTPEDWRTCGLSALWDIPTGRVLWADGAHTVDDMAQIGLPIEQFVEKQ